MAQRIANDVCFVIVLMTIRHVDVQAHHIAQLNRRLAIIKYYVDRDISNIRLQITDRKMIVDQMVIDKRNASDGSIICEPFPDHGE
ncbi:hypothetical protein DPMN_161697 [Dreissena polymorpha]|uniref:Uncharacterized protein n=1 Tax=Dreissena polymorpha TaxID=45954 RepID=A0A9D4ITM3_DREPO|nr:hypothetical protein DPMN_161697 [Dreissena polymorpha]